MHIDQRNSSLDFGPLILDERKAQQLIRSRPLLVFDLKRSLEEHAHLFARSAGDIRSCLPATSDLEDGLQLSAIWVRMRAGHHLDYQAAQRPDVGFAGVGCLLDDFGRHPEDGTLERNARSATTLGVGDGSAKG